MILVVGGTGRLGSLVARRLINRGARVRIMTRNAQRAERRPSGVEVVVGDLREPASLIDAVDGIEVVVAAAHGFDGSDGVTPATVDRDGNINLIDAIRGQGSELVLMSLAGASADAPLELQRMKHAACAHAAASGVPTTVIGATAFADLWIWLLDSTAAKSGRPVVFGRGRNPINFVAVGDVAALVEIVVCDPSTRGQTLEIGGPENLTMNRLAALVQKASGRTRPPRHVPPVVLRAAGPIVARVNASRGRQIRASLVMDTVDMTFDARPIHRAFPGLPSTPVEAVVSAAAG